MKYGLKLVFILETIVTALVFGLVTYFIIYERLADGHRLTAYIYNLALIAIILILDKVTDTIMMTDGFLKKDYGVIRNFLSRVLFVTHFVSFKTALYLFYIVMLIMSRISILEPDIIDRYQLGFIYSVEYGIVLLIPLDKFIDLITKDDRRIHKIMAKLKGRSAN